LSPNKEFTCRGLNYSVALGPDAMTIGKTRWGRLDSHELPFSRISSVIVRRKSIMPFATLTALGAIATVLIRFNLLWFLVDLSQAEQAALSTIPFIITVLCAIPTASRALFVEIAISWGGKPESFLVRFVPQQQGRALAEKFHRAAGGM
jgi:hypothetical protein